jgi:hypothetical protein
MFEAVKAEMDGFIAMARMPKPAAVSSPAPAAPAPAPCPKN